MARKKRFLPYHVARNAHVWSVYKWKDETMRYATKMGVFTQYDEAREFAYRMNGEWMRNGCSDITNKMNEFIATATADEIINDCKKFGIDLTDK
ncbi:MAG: hypothetical protein RSF78_10165 [Bacteroidales bacterium]